LPHKNQKSTQTTFNKVVTCHREVMHANHKTGMSWEIFVDSNHFCDKLILMEFENNHDDTTNGLHNCWSATNPALARYGVIIYSVCLYIPS